MAMRSVSETNKKHSGFGFGWIWERRNVIQKPKSFCWQPLLELWPNCAFSSFNLIEERTAWSQNMFLKDRVWLKWHRTSKLSLNCCPLQVIQHCIYRLSNPVAPSQDSFLSLGRLHLQRVTNNPQTRSFTTMTIISIVRSKPSHCALCY